MGNRSRVGKQLFSLNDLLYEVSDYMIVLELAHKAKLLKNEDRGLTLKSLQSSLFEAVREYGQIYDRPTIDIKHLYPVAKHLVEPKANSSNQCAWLIFNKEDGTYKYNRKIPNETVRVEMKKFALAIEALHERISLLLKQL